MRMSVLIHAKNLITITFTLHFVSGRVWEKGEWKKKRKREREKKGREREKVLKKDSVTACWKTNPSREQNLRVPLEEKKNPGTGRRRGKGTKFYLLGKLWRKLTWETHYKTVHTTSTVSVAKQW
ncbi:hypothetical protein LSTR_LSTR012959 [Laodelphax striatellus]|uniref:Secreted protein n=1 Tax=Laodelphax striatellus TaxID=195883 RepID=A0A482XEK8_LAOST|nr:hypothetical protein LSTR_LSTR012959 [Laodelphax striatellus]